MSIGENIKILRIRNNITRKELAEKINVTDVTISRYENNTRAPGIQTLNKIATALNVNINQLLDNNNEDQNDSSDYCDINGYDRVEFERDIHFDIGIESFFKGLGLNFSYDYNEKRNTNIFIINDVKYEEEEFYSLIQSIKSHILNINDIIKQKYIK